MLSFSINFKYWGKIEATVAQQAEQLICNQRVGGSIPFGGSRERFPSGQREQTVNLPAQPSEVRILPSPPLKFFESFGVNIKGFNYKCFSCGSSSVVERQPSKLRVAGSNPVSRSIDIIDYMNDFYVGGAHVAQLAEHILGKDEVTGSIPVMGL